MENNRFDVIVIGGGHAGCEAASIISKLGGSVALVTLSARKIGVLSCNPSIGGVGKGQLVVELDILGGIMSKIADMSSTNVQLLNMSKGQAVHSLRAQLDSDAYPKHMQEHLNSLKTCTIIEAEVSKIIEKEKVIHGVLLSDGRKLLSSAVIISTGTFMSGTLYCGMEQENLGGRRGEKAAFDLVDSLKSLGLHLKQLYTGTPARIDFNTIDFSAVSKQSHSADLHFSYDTCVRSRVNEEDAYITSTTPSTKKIVEKYKASLDKHPLHDETSPRYCPSIEAKCLRFSAQEKYPVFLEPMGNNRTDVYVNGLTTKLGKQEQRELIRSVKGLESAEIVYYGYQVRYDIVDYGQLKSTLETKQISGLYLAGQINGTTGYEEAAVQGFIAGVNSLRKLRNEHPYIPSPLTSYIGVLLDDLVTKEHFEPYRIFPSRSPWRLYFRSDNADIRLKNDAVYIGTASKEFLQRVEHKESTIKRMLNQYKKIFVKGAANSLHVYKIISTVRSYEETLARYPEYVEDFGYAINKSIEMHIKYEPYIKKIEKEIQKLLKFENMKLPEKFDYTELRHISKEAQVYLTKVSPSSVGQASRMAAVTSADLQLLIITFMKRRNLIKNGQDGIRTHDTG